jgi:DNA-binding response OmpR family regulator
MKATPPVVLIDDDRGWLETLSDYLQGKGFDVWTARGARPGLAVLEEHDISVAVIDFQMPDMNGLELLRAIRERGQHVAVLLLSSEEDPHLAERALELGAQGFLSKNLAPRKLLRRLMALLALAAMEAILSRVLSSRPDNLLPPPEPDDNDPLRRWNAVENN